MEYYKKQPDGTIYVPRETVEHFEQISICTRLSNELLQTYGPTDQVLGIISDCQKHGFPRALFNLNGTEPTGRERA